MKPVPTTPTVAEDCDKILDDELVLSAGDPDVQTIIRREQQPR